MNTITPYVTTEQVTLYTGDTLQVLAQLPDASVDCVVTSPPYYFRRDYGTGIWKGGDPDCAHLVARGTGTPRTDALAAFAPPGSENRRMCRRCSAVRHDRQYGLEPTVEEYVATLRRVFAEVHRVLTRGGTVWLNLGDSYAATPPGRAADPARTSTLAFALQADGWIIRNAVAWHKPNAMPEPVKDRLTCRYELLFLLVKQRRYVFNLDAVREPLARPERSGRASWSAERARADRLGSMPPHAAAAPASTAPPQHTAAHALGKNPGDVWRLPTRPLRAAHIAAFPVDIPSRCIAAGCPPRGVVLDPFSGSGTTGLAATRLGRTYIGIDLRRDFHDIALERLGLPHPGIDEQPRDQT